MFFIYTVVFLFPLMFFLTTPGKCETATNPRKMVSAVIKIIIVSVCDWNKLIAEPNKCNQLFTISAYVLQSTELF